MRNKYEIQQKLTSTDLGHAHTGKGGVDIEMLVYCRPAYPLCGLSAFSIIIISIFRILSVQSPRVGLILTF